MIATIDTLTVATEAAGGGLGEFIAQNWGELVIGILAFAKIVVNLTPTETDNKIFGWIDSLINMIIADRKKRKPSVKSLDHQTRSLREGVSDPLASLALLLTNFRGFSENRERLTLFVALSAAWLLI